MCKQQQAVLWSKIAAKFKDYLQYQLITAHKQIRNGSTKKCNTVTYYGLIQEFKKANTS